MIVFMVVAALMCLAACFLLLWPAIGGRTTGLAGQDVLDVSAQHAELERQAQQGTLAPADFETARQDLARRVLDQVLAVAGGAGRPPLSRATAVAMTLFVPLIAAALYWQVGSPQALRPDALMAESGEGNPHAASGTQMQAQIAQLEKRLAQAPDDAKGWVMLGRSHTVLGNYLEAVKAYARAVKLAPQDAQVLVDYADVLAMSQGRNLEGEPVRLIGAALKLDPDNIKGLLLAGTAAFERKDYRQAVDLWGRVPSLAPDDTALLATLDKSIQEARALGGIAAGDAARGPVAKAELPSANAATPATAGAGGQITGRVTLAAALAGKANPDDTVFIFARAAQGPKMPLAVLRKRVKDLPADFALDDSMAMAPALRLSAFAEIVVTARVSKSGDPAPRSGDLQAVSQAVKLGAAGIRLEIAEVLP